MKKIKHFCKYLLFIILLIPAMFLTACVYSERSIVDIKKTSTNGLVDTYTITYSDNTTSTFQVTNGKNGFNGKDAQNVSIDEIYEALKAKGYTKSFEEFLKEYLNYEVQTSDKTASINTALMSSLSIYSEFKVIAQEATGIFTTKDVKKTLVSAGSGVIYRLNKNNGDAYLITNYHVVYNNEANEKIGKIYAFLYGSSVEVAYKTDSSGNYVYDENGYPVIVYGLDAIECTYIGGSLNYDIAVLKITGNQILKQSDAKAIKISDKYVVGDTAIAIGNPEAEGISVTEGIVSVESEYISMTGVDNATNVTFRTLRIDTAINSGNSGGGLFNERGELIGIVNAKIVDTEIENIAYAIPKDIAINVADNLIYNYELSGTKKVKKITIGLALQIDNSRAVFDNNTKTSNIIEQVSIKEVQTQSVGESAGFKVNDQLKSITVNDKTVDVTRMFNAIDLALTIKVGDSVTYTVVRDGVETNIYFTAPASAFGFVE